MKVKPLSIVVGLAIVLLMGILIKNPETSSVLPVSLTSDVRFEENYYWKAPDTNSISKDEAGMLIRYGRVLFTNTSAYLGPKGSVSNTTNGLNCQNCHLDAGTRIYSNNMSAVASIYPVYRARSGIVESIEFRVNDCLKRSLDGNAIDTQSHEMKAIVAYIKWLGKKVPKGIKPVGARIMDLPFLDRAADSSKGAEVYNTKCKTCHRENGGGVLKEDSTGFVYPPLWGHNSYNTGAGLYRLSRFAGYVKNSMPFGATHANPQLTDEEAWDVAAYVNSQSRPVKHFAEDWPNLEKKSIDFPFGPYVDSFSERQHKYGPYKPIVAFHEKHQKK